MKKNDYKIMHYSIFRLTFPILIFCSWSIFLGVIIFHEVMGDSAAAANAVQTTIPYIIFTAALSIFVLFFYGWKIDKLLEK